MQQPTDAVAQYWPGTLTYERIGRRPILPGEGGAWQGRMQGDRGAGCGVGAEVEQQRAAAIEVRRTIDRPRGIQR
ncbi:MAG: hypothetical protein IPL52_11610 [Flavobacteriales bacterium]|nr:hypothetical protein [Flavobacteriales bacterium]